MRVIVMRSKDIVESTYRHQLANPKKRMLDITAVNTIQVETSNNLGKISPQQTPMRFVVNIQDTTF